MDISLLEKRRLMNMTIGDVIDMLEKYGNDKIFYVKLNVSYLDLNVYDIVSRHNLYVDSSSVRHFLRSRDDAYFRVPIGENLNSANDILCTTFEYEDIKKQYLASNAKTIVERFRKEAYQLHNMAYEKEKLAKKLVNAFFKEDTLQS